MVELQQQHRTKNSKSQVNGSSDLRWEGELRAESLGLEGGV